MISDGLLYKPVFLFALDCVFFVIEYYTVLEKSPIQCSVAKSVFQPSQGPLIHTSSFFFKIKYYIIYVKNIKKGSSKWT